MTAPRDTTETVSFRVRRDLWDTLNFYLFFLFGLQAVGVYYVILALQAFHAVKDRHAAWNLLLLGFGLFLWGTVIVVQRIWKRFAEAYRLGPEALQVDYGYRKFSIPYPEISGVYPIKICRLAVGLKPATRVTVRKPILYLGRTIDIAVIDPERFLDELAARCPHLLREGPRMRAAQVGETALAR